MTDRSKYMYAAEKFRDARTILMAPHLEGVAASYTGAFHECRLGLRNLNPECLESDSARDWIKTVERIMDTTDISDEEGVGTWSIKAESLTDEEQYEFSRAVDELATHFDRKFWSQR